MGIVELNAPNDEIVFIDIAESSEEPADYYDRNGAAVLVGVTGNRNTALRKEQHIDLMINFAIDRKHRSLEQISEFHLLTDDAINYFISMVREKYGYDMIVANAITDTSLYSEFDRTHDDVQILFVPPSHGRSIGHWIAIHYVANRRAVYVYDSLNTRTLNRKHRAIIRCRYGNGVTTDFVRPKVLQPDTKSCGVFAIAYITSILCYKDPATYELQLGPTDEEEDESTKIMRDHLGDMFREHKIELFPSDDLDDEVVFVDVSIKASAPRNNLIKRIPSIASHV